MLILGLHFGHDASVSLLKDGRVVSSITRERLSRVKHHASLDKSTLQAAFLDSGYSAEDIDFCAITSTQDTEPVFDNSEFFSYKIGTFGENRLGSLLLEVLEKSQKSISDILGGSLLKIIDNPPSGDPLVSQVWKTMFPEGISKREQLSAYEWIDKYISKTEWNEGLELQQIGTQQLDPKLLKDSKINLGFHCPVTVKLKNRKLPGCLIHHHLAHAAASYYTSGFDSAGILSHDGFANGNFYHSGLFYYARDQFIYPLAPHHLQIGRLYDRVGIHLNLGTVGPAGKLMGLAAYGKARFFANEFVGNFKTYENMGMGKNLAHHWIKHCETLAKAMGYDFSFYRNPDHVTEKINADIAASTQKLFESIRLFAVRELFMLLCKNNMRTPNLCLTGGTSLNCPSNTDIHLNGPFERLWVEPCCDDSGVSLGAALALYHNILGNPLLSKKDPLSPFLGPRKSSEQALKTIEGFPNVLTRFSENIAEEAAQDLLENKVIAWFTGRSEIGPRALGARSILANPTCKDNWARVNRIKKREWWRPFAPVVLESKLGDWFAGVPNSSPYMLFNANVLSKDIPAVTHVDNTARVQTVNSSNGNFYRLIDAFYKLSGVPVILNTSFNGPGEPIVETATEALTLFSSSDIDVLYIEDVRITKENS